MNPSFFHIRGVLLAAAILISLLAANSAHSQRLDRWEYLEALGLSDEADVVRRYLVEGLTMRAQDWPTSRIDDTARQMAFVLAVAGITYESILELQSNGVDVVHAVAADTRPFGEQSLLSDLVVVGEVIDSQPTTEPGDGYHASAYVRVIRHLKGAAPADTIVIRQRQPRRDRDIQPEVGSTYLLLLSRGMYRYGASNNWYQRTGSIPVLWPHDYSSIYRIYRLEGDRIEWNAMSADETAAAFDEIRRIDNLLNRVETATGR